MPDILISKKPKYKFVINDFEGPLDLLLFLITKNKMNIFDISLNDLTDEYVNYIEEMNESNIEVASEFIVMAATLLDIKAKKLLPEIEPKEEEDIVSEEDIINKTEQDIAEKYIEWDIKKFSADSIVLYKEVDGVCDNDYIIKEKDGNIVIFKLDSEGRETIYDVTSIEVQYLPETDLRQLKDGIKVNGLEKLNQIIEDFE